MNQEKWDFMAQPKVMKAKGKFRESENKEKDDLNETPNHYFNLMWDKRVIRGNTYATVLTENNPIEIKPNLSKIQKNNLDKSKEQESMPLVIQEPGTPKPLPGREHVSVETDEFVETLTDKPPFYEKEIQTEFNIEKPPLRHYLPVKTGLSKETQIWDGDLFDFDYEVEPILQVLLGKTFEQSRMEVLEEEELKVMKQQQEHYQKLKREEMNEINQLEEKEKRLLNEIEKKKYENKKIREQNINSHKKIIARVISKNFLKLLKPKTFDKLENLGVFRRPIETSFFNDFVPWICKSIQSELVDQNKIEIRFEQMLIQLQNEASIKNRERVTEFFNDREEKQKEKLRLQKEKEERIRKRKEERARQAEIKRKLDLKNEIQEKLISKGELKQILHSQLLSDIDGCDKETPFIGLFGGILGELIIFFDTLKSMGFEPVFAAKKLEKNIINCLNLILSAGTVEIALDEKIMAELPKLDESLNFENILTMQIDKMSQLKDLLIQNLGSLVISKMIEEFALLKIDENLIKEILDLFFKYAFEQDNAKNIKLIKINRIQNYKKRIAVCHIFPLFEDLVLKEDILEKKEAVIKNAQTGKDTARSKDSSLVIEKKPPTDPNLSLGDSMEKENPIKVENLTEAELEDKYTVFPAVSDEFKVLVIHKVAQEIMRKDFIDEIKLENNELLGHEYEILRKVDERFNEVEEAIINSIARGIDIFHIEMY